MSTQRCISGCLPGCFHPEVSPVPWREDREEIPEDGGMQHFMEHLSGPLATWWKDLGKITEFSPEVKPGRVRDPEGHL